MRHALFLAVLVSAISPSAHGADVVTRWRGTSTCQVHPSACHDETVVYYGRETGPDSYRLSAYKVVGGKEVEMGEAVGFHSGNTLTLYTKDRAGRQSTWNLTITGEHLSGTLTTPDGVIFRRIEADRTNE